MLMAIDVGNTNIEIGIFRGDEFVGTWRMITATRKTSDEYGVFILSLLQAKGITPKEIDDVIISSVVPNIMYSLTSSIKKYLNINPMVIEPGIKTGIRIQTENPKEVGADRICDVVAAYYIYGGPAIVIDFGTATTFDYVDEDGVFSAAVTAPGIQISADALWSRAAQLPNIEIEKPKSILARNTITSMQAGLVYGYIGQVEYIVKKIKEETGKPQAKVVATGGYSKIIFPETNVIDIVDSALSLKGIKLIYERNRRTRIENR
ncbi:type III pantothenate kinase [Alkalibacter rhizosphaerae]|uniref:Type III pantothenate kinase n=1 Tax=Alkalibacter rhizosphaerae TaxID=2815577 RepID=A0A974XF14_9FIRM|nr:type III pantothenate kinase [Alkalibacter rhizosphaerae]QSX07415.1 type III pantothenate kinase [Alkalibacter rhizosphaerae]